MADPVPAETSPPEISNGFTGPSEFHRVWVPGPGNYRVRVTLGGWQTATRLTVFLGRRRCVLAEHLVVPGIEVVIHRVESVGPIIPRGYTSPQAVEGIYVTVPSGPWIRSVEVSPVSNAPTIHIAGDSTVADQSAPWPWDPASTYCGWGQMLPLFLTGTVGVFNHAHSGLTTETFRTEGHWSLMEAALKPGDIALFQFGHNDQKLLSLGAFGGYAANLRRYVAETRARGALPVLVSPVSRSLWNGPGGRFNDLLADWAAATRTVAGELGVAWVDLHGASVQLVQTWGPEGCRPYFHPGDYTHHNDPGGWEMAALVHQGLVRALPDYPSWWAVEPAGQFPALGVGRLTTGTAGTAVRDLPPEQPDDPLTRAAFLARLLTVSRILPSQVYNDIFDDIVGHEWFAGSVQAGFDRGLWDPTLTPGRFGPETVLTGAQAVDMAVRAAHDKGLAQVGPGDFDAELQTPTPATHQLGQRILARLTGLWTERS